MFLDIGIRRFSLFFLAALMKACSSEAGASRNAAAESDRSSGCVLSVVAGFENGTAVDGFNVSGNPTAKWQLLPKPGWQTPTDFLFSLPQEGHFLVSVAGARASLISPLYYAGSATSCFIHFNLLITARHDYIPQDSDLIVDIVQQGSTYSQLLARRCWRRTSGSMHWGRVSLQVEAVDHLKVIFIHNSPRDRVLIAVDNITLQCCSGCLYYPVQTFDCVRSLAVRESKWQQAYQPSHRFTVLGGQSQGILYLSGLECNATAASRTHDLADINLPQSGDMNCTLTLDYYIDGGGDDTASLHFHMLTAKGIVIYTETLTKQLQPTKQNLALTIDGQHRKIQLQVEAHCKNTDIWSLFIVDNVNFSCCSTASTSANTTNILLASGPTNTSFLNSTRVTAGRHQHSETMPLGGIITIAIFGIISFLAFVLAVTYRAMGKQWFGNQERSTHCSVSMRNQNSTDVDVTEDGPWVNSAEVEMEPSPVQVVVTSSERVSVTFTPNHSSLVQRVSNRSPYKYDNLTPERKKDDPFNTWVKGEEEMIRYFKSPAISESGYLRPEEAHKEMERWTDKHYTSITNEHEVDKSTLSKDPDPIYARILEV